jgi:hypothetical protein
VGDQWTQWTYFSCFSMLIFVEDKLNEEQIIDIRETDEEESRSFKDLRGLYIKYARTNFQGKKYHNKGLDEDVLVSRDGIDKLEGMLSFREQCLAIQLLDKFLINSTIENRMPDRKNRWNVEEFIYLTCQCSINSKQYKVITTVKKTVNNPLKFYGYVLIDIKIEATRR